MKRSGTAPAGFTLVELLLSVSIVVLVAMLFLRPAGPERRSGAQSIKCVNNLKNLGLAVAIFQHDNSGSPFISVLTNLANATVADCFRNLSNELSTPRILTCPADARVREATNFADLLNSNISFFVNRAARIDEPRDFLAGDRNLSTNGVAVERGSTLLLSSALNPGWTQEIHNDQGNVVMGDGSVQQFSSSRLRQGVKDAGKEMKVLIP